MELHQVAGLVGDGVNDQIVRRGAIAVYGSRYQEDMVEVPQQTEDGCEILMTVDGTNYRVTIEEIT